MPNIKFKLNSAGVRALLQSNEVSDMVSEVAANVARNAGEGFEVDTQPGKFRAIARVKPVTKSARDATFKNNALLKALHK